MPEKNSFGHGLHAGYWRAARLFKGCRRNCNNRQESLMYRFVSISILLACGIALTAAILPAHAHAGARHRAALLAFGTMYGVDGPFVGGSHPIGGFAGDELPWEVASAHGRLDTEGNLVVVVRGLVFKDDPSVPENLRGI